jgi:hypothetical protein
MNPVRTSKDRGLPWSEVAGDAMIVDSETQWSDIVSRVQPDPNEYYDPASGTIDSGVALQLSTILGKHTKSSTFMFLVWEGYSSLLDEVRGSATITNNQQRVMHIRRGGLHVSLEPIDFPPNRLAMNWLPDDGAWFVGNDVYARSVIVGGSISAIGAVLREPKLETYLVRPGYIVVPED